MNSNKLSTEEYWDSIYRNVKLPRLNSPGQYNYYITMNFIDPILKAVNKRTFLEIGCGASGWLPYFAKKYNYLVSGLDYSELGCHIAKENLKILNITYDEIICEDIFQWKSNKQYDVVFTYGVIEHFNDPRIILRIIYDHLNNGGISISVVPNLQGIITILFKLFAKHIYDMHKVIPKDVLIEMHENVGFYNIKTDYIGLISFNIIPWAKSENWLFREGNPFRKANLRLISALYQILSFPLKKLKTNIGNNYFSPYIVSIMKK